MVSYENFIWNGDASLVVNATEMNGTLSFSNIVDESNITYVHIENDLLIFNNDSDSNYTLTLKDFFNNQNYCINGFYFLKNNNSFSIDEIISRTPIKGSCENDYITGLMTSDNIEAKTGNDTILGLAGDDIYNYSKGDGQDIIIDTAGLDQIVLNDLNQDDLSYSRVKNDFVITIKNNLNDKITIKDWFLNDTSKIESFYFSNNYPSVNLYLSLYEILKSDKYSEFSNGLTGTNSSDVMYGTVGNDKISGLAGNDIYVYNAGNDIIADNAGNDSIYFKECISFENLVFKRSGNNLIILITNSANSSITITDWFKNTNSRIENLDFGTNIIKLSDLFLFNPTKECLNSIYIKSNNLKLNGDSNDNYILDSSKDEEIQGLAGDDAYSLSGGNDTITDISGNDIYLYKSNVGNQIINDSNGYDTLRLDSFEKENTIISRNGCDLEVQDSTTHYIVKVANWFLNTNNKIEQIILKNWDFNSIEDIENSIIKYYGSTKQDTLYGNTQDNKFISSSGNDYISDTIGGNDSYIYEIGYGNDTINDKYGNDSLIFGKNIHLKDLQFLNMNNDFYIKINDTDSIYIKNYSESSDYQLENLIFTEEHYKFDDLLCAKNSLITGTSKNDLIIVDKNLKFCSDASGGDDLYLYSPNSSKREILDTAGNDTIIINRLTSLNKLSFYRDKNNLNIYTGNASVLVIKGFFNEVSNHIENLLLDDLGLKIDYLAELNAGTQYSDTLSGSSQNDFYSANKGNDYIFDISGDDKYFYNLADGTDTINDKNGTDSVLFNIKSSKISLFCSKIDNDLVLSLNDKDKLCIKNWFLSNDNKIENFKSFYEPEKVLLNSEQLDFVFERLELSNINTQNQNITLCLDNYNKTELNNLYFGFDKADFINDYTGNDIYQLTRGNDNVNDYAGDDTYYFIIGDGKDIINDSQGNDKIYIGSSSNPIEGYDVKFSKSGQFDLKINYSENDSICIKNWFANSSNRIEEFGIFNVNGLKSINENVLTSLFLNKTDYFNISMNDILINMTNDLTKTIHNTVVFKL